MQDSDQLPCLNNYSSQSISLLASRHRIHCEPSQKSSQLSRTNENEMQEFKLQIEERFRLSIANRIYTFPKRIESINDILSSSEEEQSDSPSKNSHANKQEKINHQLFKKKSFGKTADSKRKQDLSSSKHHLHTEAQYLNSNSKAKAKVKVKPKSRKSTNKPKISSKSKQKISIKMNRTTPHNKQTTKGDRIKTQPEHDILISTIRAKIVRKY